MAPKTFKEKVEQKLKNLDREQLVQFAWRCAVRALPYLGMDGNFNFWNDKDKQKHIYAVLNAIDFAVYANTDEDDASVAARAAAYAAAEADDTDVRASYASNAYAAYAYAYAAEAAAATAATTYASSYAAKAAAAAYAAADNCQLDLEPVILQDIKSMCEGGGQIISTDIYGKIWKKFQNALKDEKCAYWAKLYQKIFDNNFEMDHEALNRRMNIPKEIKEQGATAVGNYLEELDKGSTRLNEARIIILGDKGVGKTSIAKRLQDPDAIMPLEDEGTAGVDRITWKLEEENINVRIWDFAGHTVTHAVHQFFLSERCLYILVYNGRIEDTRRFEYWLDHMKNYGGNSKAIILINKRDDHRVNISINRLNEHYDNNIIEVFNFSVKEDRLNLEDFQNYVAECIIENPSWNIDNFPISYFKVKEELEIRFKLAKKENTIEFISIDEFDEICENCNVENVEDLLQNLKNLGVLLWYKDMSKYNTLVLNPEWISEGLYKIINWVNENKKHTIQLNEFKKVFKDDGNRYPIDKHEFLFILMKHSEIELAFKIDTEKCLIIPHLLEEDRPADLPDFPVGDSLLLRYVAEQPLPPNTISRFIVRHNEEIKKDGNKYIVWRYGVVLEDGNGSLALVREEDRTISVSVKGIDKTNYISKLRDTLNDIFNTYKSKKPHLQYSVDQFGFKYVEKPIWMPEEIIQNHLLANKTEIYESYTDQNIPVKIIIENLNINSGSGSLSIAGNDMDNSTHNTFNFKDCNIGLQGNLNELAQLLSEGGSKEEAKELESAAKLLEQVEECKTKDEIKKKGIGNRLKRMVDELGDEDSKLHKTVKGIKHGIGIAQDIAKTYNDIAQWVGMPQVPKPFLK